MREILNIISNADHLEPLVCAKTHLPFQNHSSQQIDKGRERERERVLFKTSTIHWYPRDYLIIFIIIYWGTNGKILKES